MDNSRQAVHIDERADGTGNSSNGESIRDGTPGGSPINWKWSVVDLAEPT
jgi:hypothetical protein